MDERGIRIIAFEIRVAHEYGGALSTRLFSHEQMETGCGYLFHRVPGQWTETPRICVGHRKLSRRREQLFFLLVPSYEG